MSGLHMVRETPVTSRPTLSGEVFNGLTRAQLLKRLLESPQAKPNWWDQLRGGK